MKPNLWSEFSVVKRSKERFAVLRLLREPKTPTDVKRETRMHMSNVSRTIKGLAKRGLVRCLTPNEKRGRYYLATKKGREVLDKLEPPKKVF